MKTSNKILLALFLLPFITVLLIMLTLHAKIKNGDFITEKQAQEENRITSQLAPFSDIDLSAYKNGRVEIKYSDSFYIHYDKSQKENINVEQQGNKLMLKTNKGSGNYHFLTVFCPTFSALRFDSLEVFVDAMHLANARIDAGAETSLHFAAKAGKLTLSGQRGSNISFEDTAMIDTLNLQLSNGATFNNMHGVITRLGEIKLGDSAALNVGGKIMQMLLQNSNTALKQ